MTRLERDSLTWLSYAQLGANGYFLYGFGATLGLLREELDVTRAVAGLHGTASALGALVGAIAVGTLVPRWGRGRLMWVGVGLLGLGASAYASVPVLPLTLGGALTAAVGGTFIVVVSAAVLAERHHTSGAAAISEGNAVAAGVGAVAPLVVGVAVGVGLGWRAALLLVLPAAVVIAVLGRTVAVPNGSAAESLGSGRLPRRYWVSWTVVTAGIAVEFCLTLWAADLLRDRAGVSAGLAATGVTAVVAGMCIGRVAGGRLALRLPLDRLLELAIGLAAAGFAVFWLTTSWPVAFAGLFGCGLGVALFYPLGIARAIDASEGRADRASARVGLGVAVAVGAGPFGLGALADQVGIHAAFLAVPALLVVAAVGIRLSPSRPPR